MSGFQNLAGLIAFLILLSAAFGAPLYQLIRFARHSELYSHILLIPFISGYLIWLKRGNLRLASEPSRPLAAIPFLLGCGLLIAYGFATRGGAILNQENYFAFRITAFLLFALSGCFLFLSTNVLRLIAFPLAFLVFMIPLPVVIENWIESLLQYGSAETAYWLLKITAMPVFKVGTVFRLPGFSMQVAPECSGIHSTFVLFITSLLAGYLLLKRFSSRALLALAIIPVALLRNGLRISVLAHLCVRVDPNWIDSDLHHRGGPFYFAVSLLPFFLFLLFLRKQELRSRQGDEADAANTVQLH